jgi:hypothetical protein
MNTQAKRYYLMGMNLVNGQCFIVLERILQNHPWCCFIHSYCSPQQPQLRISAIIYIITGKTWCKKNQYKRKFEVFITVQAKAYIGTFFFLTEECPPCHNNCRTACPCTHILSSTQNKKRQMEKKHFWPLICTSFLLGGCNGLSAMFYPCLICLKNTKNKHRWVEHRARKKHKFVCGENVSNLNITKELQLWFSILNYSKKIILSEFISQTQLEVVL